jgi:glutaredoxin
MSRRVPLGRDFAVSTQGEVQNNAKSHYGYANVTRALRKLEKCFCGVIVLLMSNEAPQITAYLKTFCGWSEGVRAIMRKYDLNFAEKDIIKNPAFRWEMEQKTGQPLSPCVEVNGEMLPDVSGEEVEAFLIEKGLVKASADEPDASIDSSCSPEQHVAQAAAEAAEKGEPGKIVFLD